MKQIKGYKHNITAQLTGIFYNTNNVFIKNKIIFCNKRPAFNYGIKGYIVPSGKSFDTNKPIIEVDAIPPFENGDIISISTNGNITAVWEILSPHNAFYVNDICNSKCIICPQIEGQQARYDECLQLLDLVKFNTNTNIGITGGEPTLNINKLVEVLEKISRKSPNQTVHILTNGRSFKNPNVVNKLVSVKNLCLSVGIPLYSDIAEEHDYVVGIHGAFQETIQGLYNLGKRGVNIEIRTVILRQNYHKLRNIAEYIYHNLPFVSHVALMGMEYHGNAKINYNTVSIDPTEYKQELYEAVREFVRYGMFVDVYNLPLCLVDRKIHDFCRDSISTWKKAFLPQCKDCLSKNKCSGIFETSFRHSENIKPIC